MDEVSARCEGQAAPAEAMLVRPDGHVAWAVPYDEDRGGDRDGLLRALATWFGAAQEDPQKDSREADVPDPTLCKPPER